jgi:hypothetical protein
MANSTLAAIRTKVRRLTRTPSPSQLADADIDEYVNTFIAYDFPEHLRTFTLRTTFTFFCEPFIDTYATTQIPGDQFFNWDNIYTTIHEPILIAGNRSFFTQDRDQFFAMYPIVNFINQIGVGDGVTTAFAGLLNNFNGGPATVTPVMRNQVLFDSIDANFVGMEVHDDGAGNLIGDGNGTINYITGAYTINWLVAPGPGQIINSQTVPYQPSQPMTLLFFDSSIILRPIPDQAYRINMEAYIRPTQLLNAGDSPQLEEWWQYIAYGAAKKVFEDRMDIPSVQMILPEYTKQENLVLRRTLVQQAGTRASTIYTEQTELGQFGSNGVFGTGG